MDVVVVENLSPTVTSAVVEAALQQFGNVRAVEIVKNPTDSKQLLGTGRAVVKMASPGDAHNVVMHLHRLLLMIGGTPRPVSAAAYAADSSSGSSSTDKATKMRIDNSPSFLELKRLHEMHWREMDLLFKLQAEAEDALANEHAKQVNSYLKMLHTLDGKDYEFANLRSIYYHTQD